jgi:3'-phosphoadenosine 5'-phosphosulfate sulfotransferase (PAPS reductase)/FAD synthetase
MVKQHKSYRLIDEAINRYFLGSERVNRRFKVGTVILFSGGNDSTVLTHLMRREATHIAHANTGIGIEKTREFVRRYSAELGLPLLERHPPAGSRYEDIVLSEGFPGPGKHWKMYHRLKLRCIEQVQRELIKNPYRERVIFLAGRRLSESQRRTSRNIPAIERRKSAVWVSPLRDWTAENMNTYRMMHPDCPRNEVADLLHMSGECLCGSFAERGELEEIGMWFPEVVAYIRDLECRVKAAGIPEPRCYWGWGAYRERASRVGPLCSSCEHRFSVVDKSLTTQVVSVD